MKLSQLLRKEVREAYEHAEFLRKKAEQLEVLLSHLHDVDVPDGTCVRFDPSVYATLHVSFPSDTKAFGPAVPVLADLVGDKADRWEVATKYGTTMLALGKIVRRPTRFTPEAVRVTLARSAPCKKVKVRRVVSEYVCGEVPSDWDVVEDSDD